MTAAGLDLADDDLAADARGTSLALTHQTVTSRLGNPCAVKEPRFVIDITQRQVRPLRCRRNRCVHCLPINARRRAMALRYAGPQRMLRFSHIAPRGADDPLAVARVRMKRVRQALTRMGAPKGEWSWTVEVNPAGTGFHAHAVQWGPSIDQAVLQEACRRGGMGYPWIRAISATPARTTRYGLKGFGATGYGLKSFKAQGDAMKALDLNHGRLEHHTREFFTCDDGRVGVRHAESEAISELFPRDGGRYVVCDARSAQMYLDPTGPGYLLKPLLR